MASSSWIVRTIQKQALSFAICHTQNVRDVLLLGTRAREWDIATETGRTQTRTRRTARGNRSLPAYPALDGALAGTRMRRIKQQPTINSPLALREDKSFAGLHNTRYNGYIVAYDCFTGHNISWTRISVLTQVVQSPLFVGG
jgi:hypothetical protein